MLFLRSISKGLFTLDTQMHTDTVADTDADTREEKTRGRRHRRKTRYLDVCVYVFPLLLRLRLHLLGEPTLTVWYFFSHNQNIKFPNICFWL